MRQFATLSDDRLLQLVDCHESSTLIDRLSKGTPNSVIDWFKSGLFGATYQARTPSLISPLVSGVAGLSASSSSKADTLNI